jgi:hypothetical protein
MTIEQIDKIMKLYWIEKFNGCVLDENPIYKSTDIWYGLYNEKGELVVGTIKNAPKYDEDVWYYDGNFFGNDNDMFGLRIGEFKISMKRYLIKTYTLKIKELM